MTSNGGWGPTPDEPTQWAGIPSNTPANQPPYPNPSSAPWEAPPAAGWEFGGGGPGPQRNGNGGSGKGLLWALLAVVSVLVVGAVVAVAMVFVKSGGSSVATSTSSSAAKTPQSGPPAPPGGSGPVIPASGVVTVFPDSATIRSAGGEPKLGMVSDGDGMGTERIIDADCQGIYAVNPGPVFAGSGWTATHYQTWYNPPQLDTDSLDRAVLLSVTLYPDADFAQRFYAKQSAAWQGCADRTINTRNPDAANQADQFWVIGAVNASGDVTQTVMTSEGGAGWTADHALFVHGNVIGRVGVIGYTYPDDAVQTLVDAMKAKIDAAG